VHGIILEQIGHFLIRGAVTVDDHYFALGEKMHDTKQISTDTTKTVNAYPDHEKLLVCMRRWADFGVFPTMGRLPMAIVGEEYRANPCRKNDSFMAILCQS
jgi:hypothetical protein